MDPNPHFHWGKRPATAEMKEDLENARDIFNRVLTAQSGDAPLRTLSTLRPSWTTSRTMCSRRKSGTDMAAREPVVGSAGGRIFTAAAAADRVRRVGLGCPAGAAPPCFPVPAGWARGSVGLVRGSAGPGAGRGRDTGGLRGLEAEGRPPEG